MKIAIVFWGLCRSTEHTIESLQTNLFDVLEENGIEYTTFLHIWNLYRKYHNPRAGERNVYLKNTTWKYLNPDVHCIENQDTIDPTLKLKDYRKHGDPWKNDEIKDYVPFSSVDNVVRALYSLMKATELWTSSSETFDLVMYVRPDVRILQPFRMEWLNHIGSKVIYMPDFHLIEGVNDRFAFGTPATMKIYGMRYKYALQYAAINALHSERFLAFILYKHQITTCLVPFRFRRIRAGGATYDGDKDV